MTTEYLIFGRKAYPQPLELVGRLRLEGDAHEDGPQVELAQRAQAEFGAVGWVELVAVPQAAVRRVIPME